MARPRSPIPRGGGGKNRRRTGDEHPPLPPAVPAGSLPKTYSEQELLRIGVPCDVFSPEDFPRVSQIVSTLEASVTEQGFEYWPTMEFGLRACAGAVSDTASFERVCERLSGFNKIFFDLHLDPTETMKTAVPACGKAVKDVASLDAVFDRLESLARGDEICGADRWIILDFGLDAAQNAIKSPEELGEVTGLLDGFIKRMHERSVHPKALISGALKAASRLAQNPSEISRVLEEIEKAHDGLPVPDDMKSPIIQEGLLSCSDMIKTVEDIPETAAKLGSLGKDMIAHNMGFLWVFLDHLPELKRRGLMTERLAPWILDNANAIASHGLDPEPFIVEGISSLEASGLLRDEYLDTLDGWTKELVKSRINAGDVYSHTAPALAQTIESKDGLEDVSGRVTRLCRTLARNRVNPAPTILFAFNSLKRDGLCTRELIRPLLDLGQAMAEAATDPYDTLDYLLADCARQGLINSPADVAEAESFLTETGFIPLVPELFRQYKGKIGADRKKLVSAWKDRARKLVREGEVDAQDPADMALGFASLGFPEELSFRSFCRTLKSSKVEPDTVSLPSFKFTVAVEEPVHARVNKGVLRELREPLLRVDEMGNNIRFIYGLYTRPREHGLGPVKSELYSLGEKYGDVTEENALEILRDIAPLVYVAQAAFPSPALNETALSTLAAVTWHSEDASHLREPIRRYSPDASPSEVRDALFALHELYSDHMPQGRRFTIDGELGRVARLAESSGNSRLRETASRLGEGLGEWVCSMLEDEVSGRERDLSSASGEDKKSRANEGLRRASWELATARDIAGGGGDFVSAFRERAEREASLGGDALALESSAIKIEGLAKGYGSRARFTPVESAARALDREAQTIETRVVGQENVLLLPSKRNLDLAFGYVGEDCLKGVSWALKDARFHPYRMVGEGERLNGMAYPLIAELDGKKTLLVAGIQPRRRSGYNAAGLVKGVLNGFRDELAVPEAFDFLLMPTEAPYQSNKIDVKTFIGGSYTERVSFGEPLVFPEHGTYRLEANEFLRVWERQRG